MFKSDQIAEIFRGMMALKRALMFKMPDDSAPTITPSQWLAVSTIGDGAHTVKAVANELKISSSAATQLIDGLVKCGYVLRSPGKDDKRETELTLSKDSVAGIREVKRQKMERFEKVFSVLSEKELDEFAELMKKLSASINK
ncbi:MAG: DNA-binding transcriptional regulator, MarR family [Candidatus Kaiserbacteria bacterium]|nr:DNA-binding transcriptional regulator, MarR family [Candidatus Kaiserbacteria bacterium]